MKYSYIFWLLLFGFCFSLEASFDAMEKSRLRAREQTLESFSVLPHDEVPSQDNFRDLVSIAKVVDYEEPSYSMSIESGPNSRQLSSEVDFGSCCSRQLNTGELFEVEMAEALRVFRYHRPCEYLDFDIKPCAREAQNNIDACTLAIAAWSCQQRDMQDA